jgi:hypothetical protein
MSKKLQTRNGIDENGNKAVFVEPESMSEPTPLETKLMEEFDRLFFKHKSSCFVGGKLVPSGEHALQREFLLSSIVQVREDEAIGCNKHCEMAVEEYKKELREKIEDKKKWYSGGGNKPIHEVLDEVLNIIK